MTVGELLERIDSRELTEWQLYSEMEPFGEERGDLRAGIVAAVIANANRDAKKRRKPFKPADFMPKFGPRKVKTDDSDPAERRSKRLLAIVETLNAAFGGKDLRKKTNDNSGATTGSPGN